MQLQNAVAHTSSTVSDAALQCSKLFNNDAYVTSSEWSLHFAHHLKPCDLRALNVRQGRPLLRKYNNVRKFEGNLVADDSAKSMWLFGNLLDWPSDGTCWHARSNDCAIHHWFNAQERSYRKLGILAVVVLMTNNSSAFLFVPWNNSLHSAGTKIVHAISYSIQS